MRRAGACVFSRKLFLARRGRSFMYRMRPVPSVRRRRAFSPQLSERDGGARQCSGVERREEDAEGREGRQRIRIESKPTSAIDQQPSSIRRRRSENGSERNPAQRQRVVRSSSSRSESNAGAAYPAWRGSAPRAGGRGRSKQSNEAEQMDGDARQHCILRRQSAPLILRRAPPPARCPFVSADIGASSWPGRRSWSSEPAGCGSCGDRSARTECACAGGGDRTRRFP